MTDHGASPASAEADARHEYEHWHAQLAVGGLDTPWLEMLLPKLDHARMRGKRVLEVACGRGELVNHLATVVGDAGQVVGADFSLTALHKARQAAGRTGAILGCADAQRLPHPDGVFDFVVSCETLEHLPQPSLALAEFARVLRRGGTLYLTCPNYLNLSGLYRVYLRLRGRRYAEAGQPISHPLVLPGTLRLLRAAGFRPHYVAGSGHYFPLIPGRAAFHVRALDQWRRLSRWFGIHTLIVAKHSGADSA
jgi:SAM-dependent methyltransferase